MTDIDTEIKEKLDNYLAADNEWDSLSDFLEQINDEESSRVIEILKDPGSENSESLAQLAISEHLKDQIDSLIELGNGEFEKEPPDLEPIKLECEITGKLSETEASKEYTVSQLLYSKGASNRVARGMEFSQDAETIMQGLLSEMGDIKNELLEENILAKKEMEKIKNLKRMAPNFKRIKRSSEFLLNALDYAVKEHKNLKATKWGIVVRVPEEEKSAFELAALMLLPTKKIKSTNEKIKEYSYEGYKFFIIVDEHLSKKVIFSFMKLDQLRNSAKRIYDVLGKMMQSEFEGL